MQTTPCALPRRLLHIRTNFKLLNILRLFTSTTIAAFSTAMHTRLLIGFLFLSACAPAGSDPQARDGDRLRVALLTPGPITDQSWNAGAYAGLQRIRDSLGAQVSHIQTRTPAEFEENFRQYGRQRYDLVFGHGFEFQDAAVRVAPEHPHTLYITTSGNQVRPNVAGMTFAFEEASYIAGIVAAHMTRSGVIGVIGGTDLPPVRASFDAFARGVQSVRPHARVLVAYIGNWDDVSAGKEQALAQIARGADVIFQNADAAGLGVFQAARERGGAVYVIGSNADQNGIAPEVTLGSVVIDLPHALLTVAREVQSGEFTPRVVALGSREDVVRWVSNPRLEDRVPSDVRERVRTLQDQMRAGTFEVEGLDYAFPREGAAAGERDSASAIATTVSP